jgi:hypothetical protein
VDPTDQRDQDEPFFCPKTGEPCEDYHWLCVAYKKLQEEWDKARLSFKQAVDEGLLTACAIAVVEDAGFYDWEDAEEYLPGVPAMDYGEDEEEHEGDDCEDEDE